MEAVSEHVDVAIKRPIFVTGLVRTGTTALHRLLGADPAHQGLHMWLAEYPQPRPRARPGSQTRCIASSMHSSPSIMPRIRDTPACISWRPTSWRCWQLLRQSLHSVSYEALAHVPSYADWLSRQDWTPSYCRHRRNLQLIGLNDAEKRWVLKNPSHLFALDALMATYPDALVVQTHRPVETIMASMCSLAQHTTEGWSTKFVGAQIGADAMDTWSRGLERFNAARAKYDSAQFYDVDYHDLIADPLGTVADIYRHFGLTLSDEARQAMTTVHAESQRCPGPKAFLFVG